MKHLCAIASEKDAGRKIKYFVRSEMQVSYSQFASLKYTNGLRVNGNIVHANYLLQSGDEISVYLRDHEPAKNVIAEAGDVCIAYEDDDIYIIDKPAPLACQCTPKQPSGTLENRLHAHYSGLNGFVFRPLNRLDKGTSGLMASAKHAHACQILQAQLHTPSFIREYLAIVEGKLEGEGYIDFPIAKENSATVRRIVDLEQGLPALTHYCAEYTNGTRTLVRLRLETGRTHQIRVHLSALGFPIVGDFLYGHETNELPGRFALHSTRIELLHPLTKVKIGIDSPLPYELRRLIE